MQKYSVLLLYPEYAGMSPAETYYAHVTARTPVQAVRRAQLDAATSAIVAADFTPLLVIEGHHFNCFNFSDEQP